MQEMLLIYRDKWWWMYLQLSKSSHKQEKKVERRISPNQINEMREKERTDGQLRTEILTPLPPSF